MRQCTHAEILIYLMDEAQWAGFIDKYQNSAQVQCFVTFLQQKENKLVQRKLN